MKTRKHAGCPHQPRRKAEMYGDEILSALEAFTGAG